ncbi:hypothetical protein C8R41DRAFT_900286 [Lentinula lateritia]|uniref:Uncharacterized protein n=1 Tax=Lentinula lateritia TaxID=40482 RepID=A0ABQ8VT65_9AGAR|nr:hypothetical protein C8R41DRAFT_900286 [Lentinula lateritia]
MDVEQAVNTAVACSMSKASYHSEGTSALHPVPLSLENENREGENQEQPSRSGGNTDDGEQTKELLSPKSEKYFKATSLKTYRGYKVSKGGGSNGTSPEIKSRGERNQKQPSRSGSIAGDEEQYLYLQIGILEQNARLTTRSYTCSTCRGKVKDNKERLEGMDSVYPEVLLEMKLWRRKAPTKGGLGACPQQAVNPAVAHGASKASHRGKGTGSKAC